MRNLLEVGDLVQWKEVVADELKVGELAILINERNRVRLHRVLPKGRSKGDTLHYYDKATTHQRLKCGRVISIFRNQKIIYRHGENIMANCLIAQLSAMGGWVAKRTHQISYLPFRISIHLAGTILSTHHESKDGQYILPS